MKWLLIGVLISEGILRLIPWEPPLASHVAYDSLLGHKGPAAKNVSFGNSVVRYSAEGFRQIPQMPSTPSPQKIAILGDSVTEGFTISEENIFAAKIQELSAKEQKPAEAYVYASGDWGTAEEYLAMEEFALKRNPEIVILQFSGLTDFINNASGFAGRYQSVVDGIRPYFKTNSGESLELFYFNPTMKWMRDHVQLVRWINNIYLSFSLRKPKERAADCTKDPNLITNQVYSPKPIDADWENALQVTKSLLRMMNVKVKQEQNREFLALYIPNPFELEPLLWDETIASETKKCFPNLALDPTSAEKHFLAAANAAGVKAISLRPQFEKAIQERQSLFLDDGHLNEQGHLLVAKSILQILKR